MAARQINRAALPYYGKRGTIQQFLQRLKRFIIVQVLVKNGTKINLRAYVLYHLFIRIFCINNLLHRMNVAPKPVTLANLSTLLFVY